jgi:hypothetical protein
MPFGQLESVATTGVLFATPVSLRKTCLLDNVCKGMGGRLLSVVQKRHVVVLGCFRTPFCKQVYSPFTPPAGMLSVIFALYGPSFRRRQLLLSPYLCRLGADGAHP